MRSITWFARALSTGAVWRSAVAAVAVVVAESMEVAGVMEVMGLFWG